MSGFLSAQCDDPGFDGRGVLAHEDDRHARRAVDDLLDDGSELRCVAALVGHRDCVDPELLAHAVDLGFVHGVDLLGCGVSGFGGLDRNGKHVRVEEFFLMAEHADFFTDLHGLGARAEGYAPDRRRG